MTKLDDAKERFDANDMDGALEAAAQAIGENPMEAETYGIIGCIQTLRNDFGHAVDAFDRFYRMVAKRQPADDRLLDGVIPILGCRAYATVGRLDDALRCQSLVSPLISSDPALNTLYFPIQGEVMKQVGLDRVQAMLEYLIWDTEPIKAKRFLEECVPAAVSDMAKIGELKRDLAKKMRHLRGWEEYKAEYDAIPSETFHTAEKLYDFVHNLGRTRNVVAWAASLPKEGPPVEVLGVGFQDGIIESDAMEQSDRIHLTVCDVSPHAGQGLQMLQAKFPGRVRHYQIKDGHYDWSPSGRLYDAIFIFEVLEHVPSDYQALYTLRSLLKLDGTLFLSTPVADRWVEPYLTGPRGPTWYGHVRAHNPTSLWQLARSVGLEGGIDTTDRGGVYFCRFKRSRSTNSRKVSIFVPGTPHPFDPDSHLRGHLGGSEEAVLYLAPALFRQGYEVTVYAPRPNRDDRCSIVARDGVQWRPVEEFDVGADHERVLFWRCPQVFNDPLLAEVKYRKYLWLHDTHYNAGEKAYKSADGVIVLSKFHADILAEREGFKGPFSLASNGIDLAMFPSLTKAMEAKRDQFRAIYGSSPDRGLDRVIRAWPMIRKLAPRATLDVYYTWDLFDRACKLYPEVKRRFGTLRADTEALADQGVTIRGGVDHRTLTEAYLTAGVWTYPTHFEEIHCISACKAMAAGCWPVIYPYAALAETADGYCLDVPKGLDLDSSAGTEWYAARVAEKMLNPPTFEERLEMSDSAREKFGWDAVAMRFAEIIG